MSEPAEGKNNKAAQYDNPNIQSIQHGEHPNGLSPMSADSNGNGINEKFALRPRSKVPFTMDGDEKGEDISSGSNSDIEETAPLLSSTQNTAVHGTAKNTPPPEDDPKKNDPEKTKRYLFRWGKDITDEGNNLFSALSAFDFWGLLLVSIMPHTYRGSIALDREHSPLYHAGTPSGSLRFIFYWLLKSEVDLKKIFKSPRHFWDFIKSCFQTPGTFLSTLIVFTSCIGLLSWGAVLTLKIIYAFLPAISPAVGWFQTALAATSFLPMFMGISLLAVTLVRGLDGMFGAYSAYQAEKEFLKHYQIQEKLLSRYSKVAIQKYLQAYRFIDKHFEFIFINQKENAHWLDPDTTPFEKKRLSEEYQKELKSKFEQKEAEELFNAYKNKHNENASLDFNLLKENLAYWAYLDSHLLEKDIDDAQYAILKPDSTDLVLDKKDTPRWGETLLWGVVIFGIGLIVAGSMFIAPQLSPFAQLIWDILGNELNSVPIMIAFAYEVRKALRPPSENTYWQDIYGHSLPKPVRNIKKFVLSMQFLMACLLSFLYCVPAIPTLAGTIFAGPFVLPIIITVSFLATVLYRAFEPKLAAYFGEGKQEKNETPTGAVSSLEETAAYVRPPATPDRLVQVQEEPLTQAEKIAAWATILKKENDEQKRITAAKEFIQEKQKLFTNLKQPGGYGKFIPINEPEERQEIQEIDIYEALIQCSILDTTGTIHNILVDLLKEANKKIPGLVTRLFNQTSTDPNHNKSTMTKKEEIYKAIQNK